MLSSGGGCIRFVKDIGLWAFSRGAPTCKFQTSWCRQNCYNRKFYAVNPLLPDRDAADEEFWQATSAEKFALFIADLVAAHEIDRFRFSVRGEIWTDDADIAKVAKIIELCPGVLFWIPTRAWRVAPMAYLIEENIIDRNIPNARVMASVDPSVSEFTERQLMGRGWSTVFAGENDPDQLRLKDAMCVDARTKGRFKCPKTWQPHVLPGDVAPSGLCAICDDGCFSADRVEVHLRQHR